ncbi:hypothetical protein PMAYCL1PPCAC_03377, partial [Pristionchus mayeri]
AQAVGRREHRRFTHASLAGERCGWRSGRGRVEFAAGALTREGRALGALDESLRRQHHSGQSSLLVNLLLRVVQLRAADFDKLLRGGRLPSQQMEASPEFRHFGSEVLSLLVLSGVVLVRYMFDEEE